METSEREAPINGFYRRDDGQEVVRIGEGSEAVEYVVLGTTPLVIISEDGLPVTPLTQEYLHEYLAS